MATRGRQYPMLDLSYSVPVLCIFIFDEVRSIKVVK